MYGVCFTGRGACVQVCQDTSELRNEVRILQLGAPSQSVNPSLPVRHPTPILVRRVSHREGFAPRPGCRAEADASSAGGTGRRRTRS